MVKQPRRLQPAVNNVESRTAHRDGQRNALAAADQTQEDGTSVDVMQIPKRKEAPMRDRFGGCDQEQTAVDQNGR